MAVKIIDLYGVAESRDRCRSMGELLDMVFDWLECGSRFEIDGSGYDRAAT